MKKENKIKIVSILVNEYPHSSVNYLTGLITDIERKCELR